MGLTRRTGPRTGAVHVPAALLDRIMGALVKKGRQTPRGLVMKFDSVPDFLRKAMEERGRKVPTQPLLLGTFRVQNYVTGRLTNVPISVTQGSAADGRAAITMGSEKKLSLATRRERVKAAISKLGLTIPSEKIDYLADSVFSWNHGIEIEIDLPARPLTRRDLLRARAILAHELTHVADETARRYHARESLKSDALTDVDMITEELGLPEYVPKRHEELIATPRHGRKWANDQVEVTAMISEIMEEIGDFTEAIGLFRLDLHLANRRFKTREQELISFLRWASPTFATHSSEWEPKSLNRVLRAMWDRYHVEPGFARARGVLKNRRSSRRRTSLRVAGERSFA